MMGNLPKTMNAVDPDTPVDANELTLAERPVPVPGEGQVLIEVHAAGVNRPDVLQRMGLYPMPSGAPSILGLEVAGRVAALGPGVRTLVEGQEVCALVPGGGYAGYCTAHAGACLPVPRGWTMAEAAALPETFFTVWSNLFERGHAHEGEAVLVHGGTSGIGTAAIQLAKAFGLTVVVTCGSDEKCRAAEALGADLAVNYKTEDFVEHVNAFSGGVDLVLDMVGGDYLARNVECLKTRGRHISIAFQRGPKGELDIVKVMRERLVLTGSTLRPRSDEFKALIADGLAREVWPLIEAGKIKPVVDKIFPLAEAGAAHEYMEAGAHIGKIVLEVR